MSNSVYQMIEERVINQLKNGIIPWRKCYNVSRDMLCISHQSGKPYSLLNQLFLDVPGEYWSFKSITESGYKIRKGCKASKIIFWKILKKDDDDLKSIPVLKWYNVFHESDVIGIPPKPIDGITEEERRLKNNEKVERAENIINNYKLIVPDLRIAECDTIPCYQPSNNLILIPEKARFKSLNLYYSVLFHEMVHSTKKVLDRVPSYRSYGDKAREELVAEIGAALLCGYSGIELEDVIEDSSSYCANWLNKLDGNTSWMIWASKKAEEAVDYILGHKFECNAEAE